MGASKIAQAWNGGLAGAARSGAVVDRPGPCGDTAECGRLAADSVALPGMVRVAVPGSREPARWYCPGWCATYGQALADVRSIGGTA